MPSVNLSYPLIRWTSRRCDDTATLAYNVGAGCNPSPYRNTGEASVTVRVD